MSTKLVVLADFPCMKESKSRIKKNQSEYFYYTEDGLMVFTKKYHLERGYCCKSGCLHCPYGFKAK